MPSSETVRSVASKSPACKEGRTARIEKIFYSVSCVLPETGFPSMILSTISLVVVEAASCGAESFPSLPITFSGFFPFLLAGRSDERE